MSRVVKDQTGIEKVVLNHYTQLSFPKSHVYIYIYVYLVVKICHEQKVEEANLTYNYIK